MAASPPLFVLRTPSPALFTKRFSNPTVVRITHVIGFMPCREGCTVRVRTIARTLCQTLTVGYTLWTGIVGRVDPAYDAAVGLRRETPILIPL